MLIMYGLLDYLRFRSRENMEFCTTKVTLTLTLKSNNNLQYLHYHASPNIEFLQTEC